MNFLSLNIHICVVVVVLGNPKPQYFIKEPRDKTVMAGTRTLLSCKIGRRQGKCQWTKDGFGMGTQPDLPGFPRFSMHDGSSNCHLEIQPVLPEDEGVYKCQVGAVSGGVPPIISAPAKLRVIAEPGQPYILQASTSSQIQVKSGNEVSLVCESQGSKPPAKLEWLNGKTKEIITAPVSEEVHKIKDAGTFKTASTITIKPNEDMNIICSASSEEFPSAKYSRSLLIKLRHKPTADIDISKSVIKEGDSFEVVCKSEAFPEEMAFKWFFSGRELEGQINNTLIIEEISRLYDQTDIKCMVENEEGTSEVSTTLNVEFPPTILLHPKSQIAKRKENVTFHCVAEGNPQPVYLWTKGGPAANILAGYRQNLSLVASERTENVYVCKVFSDGNEIVSSMPASLTLIRRPVIVAESTRYGLVGQDVIIQCRTNSVSNETVILWTKDDQPLQVEENRLKIKVVNVNKPGTQQSDLLIRNLREDDFDQYGCFASNEVGTDYKLIMLRNGDEVTNLSYIVGIPFAVGTSILVVLVIYCRFFKQRSEKR